MKVFITSDIEGTHTVCNWEETETDKRFYPEYATRMTNEVAAVCRGINNVDDNSDILVKDSHHTARNINIDDLPENVRINRGWSGHPFKMMNQIDTSFNASMMTGYHSGGGRGGHPLAHTMSMSTPKLWINGVLGSEFLMNYYTSLYVGVPVILVSGNEELCEHVSQIDPFITTCVTSYGNGGSTTSEHPSIVIKKLESAAETSMRKIPQARINMPRNFGIQLEYKENSAAYKASFYPGCELIDAHTIGFECDDYFDFLKMFSFVFF